MTRTRPFSFIAAIIFSMMALVHAYRLVRHFRVVVGSHSIPMSASILAVIVAGLLAIALFRESRAP